jgi:hypothetical protein
MSRRRRQSPTGHQVNRGRASYRQTTRPIQPGGLFKSASHGAPPVSWRRTAFDDAPGSQSDCAPSRAHSAKGTLRRLSRELPRGNETTAYYTDNLEDAVNTAVEMARKRTLETPPYGAKRRVLPDRA